MTDPDLQTIEAMFPEHAGDWFDTEVEGVVEWRHVADEPCARCRADAALARVASRLAAAEARAEAAEADARQKADALAWLQEFASKMSDQHTGFVHVERKCRAALGRA